jgi:hypothetical protein
MKVLEVKRTLKGNNVYSKNVPEKLSKGTNERHIKRRVGRK